MSTAAVREAWSTCVERYICYDRHCGIFKIIELLVIELSSNRRQDRCLDGNRSRHPSANVSSAPYYRQTGMDCAIKCTCSAHVEQAESPLHWCAAVKSTGGHYNTVESSLRTLHSRSALSSVWAPFSPFFNEGYSLTVQRLFEGPVIDVVDGLEVFYSNVFAVTPHLGDYFFSARQYRSMKRFLKSRRIPSMSSQTSQQTSTYWDRLCWKT